MEITRRWYGSGLTDPTVLTPSTAGFGDTPFDTIGGSPVYTDEAIDFPIGTGAVVCRWTGLDLAELNIRAYFALGGLIAAVPILSLFDTGGSRIARFDETSSGQLVVRNAANSGVAYSGGFSVGTVYVADFSYNASTGAASVLIQTPAGEEFWSKDYATGTTNHLGQLRVGRDSSTSAGPIDIGRILLSNTDVHLGPDSTATDFDVTGPTRHAFSTSATQHAFTVTGPTRN
jgi:hypothetical protein